MWRAGSIDSCRIATTSSEECDAKPCMRFDEGTFLFLVSGSFFSDVEMRSLHCRIQRYFLKQAQWDIAMVQPYGKAIELYGSRSQKKSASCKALP